jgi:hypothetical protein
MLVGTARPSREQMIEYLRTLPSIRERCGRGHDLAKQGKLQYFDYHPEKEESVTDYCIRIIRVRILFRCCVPFLSLLTTTTTTTSAITAMISQR